MTANFTTLDWAIKRHYEGGRNADVAMRNHPRFAKISKRKNKLIGSDFRYTVRYQNSQGQGADLSDAIDAISAGAGKQLAATPKLQYHVLSYFGPDMMRAKSDKAAFYDLVTMHADGAHEEFGDQLAFLLYGDGTGARGRVSSEASEVLTLTNPADARNFKIGMTLEADDAAAGTSLNVGTTFVTAINLKDGKVTTEDASDANIVANDYLFRKGDAASCMEGLAKCTPLTAPTAGDSFRGIDRSSFVELLAGSRVDNTAASIEENLGLCAVNISMNGRKVDTAYLNPINWWAVSRRLNAKVEFEGAGGEAGYGFEYITIYTPGGAVRVYSDPDCPTNRGYLCNPESEYLAHNDELIHVIRDGGVSALRAATTDHWQVRLRSDHNYIQVAPSDFGVISI